MCKCVLPPGDNPIAVNKYIISYTTIFSQIQGEHTKQRMYITNNYTFLMQLVLHSPYMTVEHEETTGTCINIKTTGTGRAKHLISLHSQIWILVVTAVIHVHYQ